MGRPRWQRGAAMPTGGHLSAFSGFSALSALSAFSALSVIFRA
jgi:hypothetical protein